MGQNSGRLGWAWGSMPNIGRGEVWRIPEEGCLQLKGGGVGGGRRGGGTGQNSGRLGWARGSMPNIGRGGEWRIPAGTCLQLKG